MECTRGRFGRLLVLPSLGGMLLLAGCDSKTPAPQTQQVLTSDAPRLLPEMDSGATFTRSAVLIPASCPDQIAGCRPAAVEYRIARLPKVEPSPAGPQFMPPLELTPELTVPGPEASASEVVSPSENDDTTTGRDATPTTVLPEGTETADRAPREEPQPADPASDLLGTDAAEVGPITGEDVQAAEDQRQPLPWSSAAVSGPEMDAVSRRADVHTDRGIRLAERGATYAARAEFIRALEVVAQALDGYSDTSAHTASLKAGLQALQESEDFVPRGSRLAADLDVAALIDSHRTPILKTERERATPLIALERYYTYAQEQLAVAVGKQPPGSRALYALGKMQSLPQRGSSPPASTAAAHAVVFHQAALEVDAKNAPAANELGVLLARHGRLEEAKQVLRHSLMVSPGPAAWRNLAVVYRQLGQPALAQKADQQAALPHSGQSRAAVEWVDPETFAASDSVGPAPVMNAADKAVASQPQAASRQRRNIADWLPWAKTKRQ